MPIPYAQFGELIWIVGGYFFLASVVKKMRPIVLPKSSKQISGRSSVLVGCHAIAFGCMYVFPVAKAGLFWLVLILGIVASTSIVFDYLPNQATPDDR
jgi:hypothetical protein